MISIIIPIYNAERYLKRCLDSICDQSYKNLEIILVNDGSTDNSLQICEEYKRKDYRIEILNKKNEGVSIARNLGIDIAKGRYILFVDCDDWLEPNLCEKSISMIEKENVKVLTFGFFIDIEGRKTIIHSPGNSVDNSLEAVRQALDLETWVLPWNKLYHKTIFKEIRFNEKLKCANDWNLFPLIAEKVGKFAVLNEPLYHFCHEKKQNTLSSGTFRAFQMQRLNSYDTWFDFGNKSGFTENDFKKLRNHLAFSAFRIIFSMKNINNENIEFAKVAVRYIRENQTAWGHKNLHIADRMFSQLIAFGFPVKVILPIRTFLFQLKRGVI